MNPASQRPARSRVPMPILVEHSLAPASFRPRGFEIRITISKKTQGSDGGRPFHKLELYEIGAPPATGMLWLSSCRTF